MMPSDPASAPRVDAPLPNTPSHARPKDAWKAEAQKPSFGKAIDQNLDALSKTIDAHKDFDAEFLRILQKDIDMLGEVYQERHEPLDSYLWTELRQKNTRLSEIAARAQSSASAGLKEGNENIPLVGARNCFP